MKEITNVYKSFARKPDENIPLERPKRRFEDNIKMDLRYYYVRCEGAELN
jgi:hypothetical protein